MYKINFATLGDPRLGPLVDKIASQGLKKCFTRVRAQGGPYTREAFF